MQKKLSLTEELITDMVDYHLVSFVVKPSTKYLYDVGSFPTYGEVAMIAFSRRYEELATSTLTQEEELNAVSEAIHAGAKAKTTYKLIRKSSPFPLLFFAFASCTPCLFCP